MLGWAVTFLIIALIAAVLGFGGIAAASAGIAKILFFIFLVMCVIFYFWLAWQRSSLIRGRVWLVSLWRSASRRLVACSYTVKARVRPLVSQALLAQAPRAFFGLLVSF